MMSLDELLEGGEAALETLKAEKTQESVTLDFKTDHEDAPLFKERNLSKHGRFVFAKAISAFANTGGGRIIVGVDCAKDDEGIDCVRELAPIENYEAICSALSHVSSTILQPSVPGLDVHNIPSDRVQQHGYIVVEVPRSERRPHRCEVTNKQYFKRSGSSSIAMEHYEIEDAFRRTGTPDLRIETLLRARDGEKSLGRTTHEAVLDIIATNKGAASAKHISFSFQRYPGLNYRLGPSRHYSFQHTVLSDWLSVSADPALIVHPGQRTVIFSLNFEVFSDTHQILVNGQEEQQSLNEIECTVYAENMRPKSSPLTFTYEDILRKVIGQR